MRAAETAGQTFSDYPPRNAGNATYHLPVYLILVASPALIRPLDRIEVAPHESDPQNTCMTTSVYVLRSPIDAPWAYVDTRCNQRSSNQATLNDRTPRDRTHSYRIYSHSIYTAVLRTCNIDLGVGTLWIKSCMFVLGGVGPGTGQRSQDDHPTTGRSCHASVRGRTRQSHPIRNSRR